MRKRWFVPVLVLAVMWLGGCAAKATQATGTVYRAVSYTVGKKAHKLKKEDGVSLELFLGDDGHTAVLNTATSASQANYRRIERLKVAKTGQTLRLTATGELAELRFASVADMQNTVNAQGYTYGTGGAHAVVGTAGVKGKQVTLEMGKTRWVLQRSEHTKYDLPYGVAEHAKQIKTPQLK